MVGRAGKPARVGMTAKELWKQGWTEKTGAIGTSISGTKLAAKVMVDNEGGMNACNSKDVSNSSNTVTACTSTVHKQYQRLKQ